MRYLSLGLTSFSLKDTLVGLGLTAASTIDTSDLFTLKDAKALYVPAYPNMLGALAEGSFALLAALRVDQRQAHTQRGGHVGGGQR